MQTPACRWTACAVPLVGLFGLVGCSDYSFHGKEAPVVGTEDPSAPTITIAPDPIDFGVLESVETVAITVTIGNPGDADLRIAAVRLDGPAVFSVTSPAADTLAPGEATTLVVSYTPEAASSEDSARLDVSSNDPDRPTASVPVFGAIELESIDSGEPGPDEGTECNCPEGYEAADTDDYCFREFEVAATATGEVVEVCAVAPYVSYGKFGARYPGGGNLRDAYWGQDDGSANGRLNSVGVWGCTSPGSGVAGHDPIGSWVGFSVCVDLATDGDYLLGLGGDNRVRFAVDGMRIMEQTGDVTSNFDYWWMYAIPLTAGTHIIDVEGYNAHSIAAFGAELSGPFPSGTLTDDTAMQAADYAGHIVWATSDAIGNAFPIGDSVSWECPDGTVLEGCEEPVCVGTEEVPCERVETE
jgi:hypothetical protein